MSHAAHRQLTNPVGRALEVAEKVSLAGYSEHSEESVLPKKLRKSGFLGQTPPSE
jgi:hypothetical protein